MDWASKFHQRNGDIIPMYYHKGLRLIFSKPQWKAIYPDSKWVFDEINLTIRKDS